MDAARQEFREKMAQYNMALARMAGVAERLKGQVKLKTQRATIWSAASSPTTRPATWSWPAPSPASCRSSRPTSPPTWPSCPRPRRPTQANLRQAKVVQKEFEDKVKRLEKQLDQVKIKEAQAEAAGALTNASFKVGDLGDTMKTVDEVLQKRYEQAAGKARVAKDLVDMDKVREKENESKALEQAALAEFLASQGIQAGATPQGPAAQKEMGPSQWLRRSPGSPFSASCSRWR